MTKRKASGKAAESSTMSFDLARIGMDESIRGGMLYQPPPPRAAAKLRPAKRAKK